MLPVLNKVYSRKKYELNPNLTFSVRAFSRQGITLTHNQHCNVFFYLWQGIQKPNRSIFLWFVVTVPRDRNSCLADLMKERSNVRGQIKRKVSFGGFALNCFAMFTGTIWRFLMCLVSIFNEIKCYGLKGQRYNWIAVLCKILLQGLVDILLTWYRKFKGNMRLNVTFSSDCKDKRWIDSQPSLVNYYQKILQLLWDYNIGSPVVNSSTEATERHLDSIICLVQTLIVRPIDVWWNPPRQV